MSDNPYEGLPTHMRPDLQHTVMVTVWQQRRVIDPYDGQEKIMLDAKPKTHNVQVERDGVGVMKADLPDRWERGHKGGHRWG